MLRFSLCHLFFYIHKSTNGTGCFLFPLRQKTYQYHLHHLKIVILLSENTFVRVWHTAAVVT